MVTPFEFATAARVLFGHGRVSGIAPLTREFGKRALVVTGSNPDRATRVVQLLRGHNIKAEVLPVPGEPQIELVSRGAELARETGCQCIIGFGGGSAIDAAKAIAALAMNHGNIFDYLEVVGKAQPLRVAPLPCIAVPTTAGAGAEVTRNAVLTAPEQRIKVSLRHPLMLPRVAIVDPELTHDLPPALTASTGMDALTQLIEPFLSRRANALTDALCRDGIPRVARSLRRAFNSGSDAEARAEMSLASLLGGMALANAGLGAVHGFASPIGGMFLAPHGAVCAALLPPVMEFNLRVASEQHAEETLRRFAEIAGMLTGTKATPDDGIQWARQLCTDLRIRGLSAFGIRPVDLPLIAEKAAQSSSMRGNPVDLTPSQLVQVLECTL